MAKPFTFALAFEAVDTTTLLLKSRSHSCDSDCPKQSHLIDSAILLPAQKDGKTETANDDRINKKRENE